MNNISYDCRESNYKGLNIPVLLYVMKDDEVLDVIIIDVRGKSVK